ncbi:hypothetical protein BZA05DRAFT_95751 [Tricharina praecox]|uniref:uncharacterized protein n=1 Tax=Tricharina praecox TaxID=43433 RepID=UPI002220E1EA|nr:uncharacterized protein BZA05DRAFT_95751 [Tricharina praecox]KAI5848359.1 hypothetical protein BZA05DRAFT_95751 [Tricharina praecox]
MYRLHTSAPALVPLVLLVVVGRSGDMRFVPRADTGLGLASRSGLESSSSRERLLRSEGERRKEGRKLLWPQQQQQHLLSAVRGAYDTYDTYNTIPTHARGPTAPLCCTPYIPHTYPIPHTRPRPSLSGTPVCTRASPRSTVNGES